MNKNQPSKYKVITPTSLSPQPNDDKKKIARLIAGYLKSDITFIKRAGFTTPDLEAIKLNQIWEIKNIRGNDKNTINRALKGIYRQSDNVIIGLFRTKMNPTQAVSRAKQKLARANRIKRLVVVTKSAKIIVIK